MTPNVDQFEKLGVFYLGRKYDLNAGNPRDELLLYDSRDLLTHALCVGMTGSGKTGLCLSLLEEAAIDGIPIICVDPKGDLTNLALTFPNLTAEDFKPWLEQSEATRRGKTLDQLAKDTAELWREGLAKWGQDGERITRLRSAADVTIYTPGSSSGVPLTVLRGFDAPTAKVVDDPDAMRERVGGAASGLLALLGIEADPLLSREHILVSSILDRQWREGKSVSIAEMIGLIQSPPFDRVGVLDLNTFMPIEERAALAMRLNNLLASPAFATWLHGESLDIQKLLTTSAGRPRVSILSIAHLSDTERMFFLTILLNELVAWMRAQSGTSSLRAIFYMDEVFGYFPPTAKPPTKAPMLTLLKQARAFGLGIVLATQNPVDLDYKGLSNMGTWFLGRLQTDRDKQRVLDGLEGAAATSGQAFDRRQMEQTLAGLGNRVFLMNNVHDDQPTLFQTRWALSFLAGPLSRDQISSLVRSRSADHAEATGEVQPIQSAEQSFTTIHELTSTERPIIPAGVEERFIVAERPARPNTKTVYRPAMMGAATLHYVRAAGNVDLWRDTRLIVACDGDVPNKLWESAEPIDSRLRLEAQPEANFEFEELPTAMRSAANFQSWEKSLGEFCFRHCPLVIYQSPLLKQYAPPGASERDARLELTQQAREARDREVEKLRAKYASRMESLDKRIRTAEERLAKQRSEMQQASVGTVISLGESLMGALFGSKLRSRANVSRAKAVARDATRAARERDDVRQAEDSLRELSADMMALNEELRTEIDRVSQTYAFDNLELKEVSVAPRKGDLRTQPVTLVWSPWQVDSRGATEPLF